MCHATALLWSAPDCGYTAGRSLPPTAVHTRFPLMAASITRIGWSLFLPRLAVGGMALLAGLLPLLHSRLPTTLVHAGQGLIRVVRDER